MATTTGIEDHATLGYLDEVIYDETKPVSAHLLRTIAANANQLTRRRQTVFCVAYQYCAAGNLGASPYYGRFIVRPWWQPVFAPIFLHYRPGARRGTCYIHFGNANEGVRIRVRTNNTNLNVTVGNAIYEKTTVGSFSTSTIPLVLDPSGRDTLWIEMIGSDFSTQATIGGAPYSGSCVLANGAMMFASGATWDLDTDATSHANYGHVVRFGDQGDDLHSAVYAITNVNNAESMFIWPFRDETVSSDSLQFEIFDAPIVNIAGVLVVADYE